MGRDTSTERLASLPVDLVEFEDAASVEPELALFNLPPVQSPRLGEIAFLEEFRLLDLFASGERGLLAFLIANGAVAGEFDALRGAAHLDVLFPREPRLCALALDVERLALGIEISFANFNLGALLDLVAHAATLSSLSPLCDRPSSTTVFTRCA